MRVMMKVRIPVEAGNAAVKSGLMRDGIREFAERAKPEAMFFTLDGGVRTMYAVLEMASSADMPRLGEPLLMGLNAGIDITPCMNVEELSEGLKAAHLA